MASLKRAISALIMIVLAVFLFVIFSGRKDRSAQ